jgi:AcrR family transcriptional regulator
VLAAAIDVLVEDGYERLEVPEVARRAGVHASTVYRRWGSKARLVGEALLERGRPLSPTPDTGSFRTDLERLLLEGGTLLRTPPVRAMFEVLIGESSTLESAVARARDRFFAAHMEEAQSIIDRAVVRGELPAGTDAGALIELVIGAALVRTLLMGHELTAEAAADIVTRAQAALRSAH